MPSAAPGPAGNHRGAPRLLEHCAVVERLVELEGAGARVRLEHELGGPLASLLCRALVQQQPARAAALAL